MGVDFLARKMSKKQNKKAGREAQRVRAKTTKKRGIRGMCYLTPDKAAQAEGLAGPPPLTGTNGKRRRAAEPPEREPPSVFALLAAQTAAQAAPPLAPAAAAPPAKRARLAPADGAFPSAPAAWLAALHAAGHATATAVQAATWPPAAAGRDIITVAPPGSGKTLAYLVPLIARAASVADTRPPTSRTKGGVKERPPWPVCLVLLPTRELTQQVTAAGAAIARHLTGAAVAIGGVWGGAPIAPQAQGLASSRPGVLVATPGRLLDLVSSHHVTLDAVTAVALDEADRMLHLGFGEQLSAIRGMLPAMAQCLMASATFPPAVKPLSAAWLTTPVRLDTARGGGAARSGAAAGGAGVAGADSAVGGDVGVTETVHVCAEHKKAAKLLKRLASLAAQDVALGHRQRTRVLVFANRIATVGYLDSMLRTSGTRCVPLHGGRTQAEREAALAAFRAGKADVMVATDVAARGLHVGGLTQVVLWDFPSNLESYIHRVGRAGHLSGGGGASLAFFTRPLARLAPDLVAHLKRRGQWVDPNLTALADAVTRAAAELAGGGGQQGVEAGEGRDDGDAAPPPESTTVRPTRRAAGRRFTPGGPRRAWAIEAAEASRVGKWLIQARRARAASARAS